VQDPHLYRFTTGPEREPGTAFACTADLAQGLDDDPALPTWDVRLDELLGEPGERLQCRYDYGDSSWLTQGGRGGHRGSRPSGPRVAAGRGGCRTS